VIILTHQSVVFVAFAMSLFVVLFPFHLEVRPYSFFIQYVLHGRFDSNLTSQVGINNFCGTAHKKHRLELFVTKTKR